MTIRWIENVSKQDVNLGWHMDAGPNAMLIRIQDPATEFGNIAHKQMFKEVHEFEFLDAEDADGFDEDFKISDEQAQQLVTLLQRALDNSMNVVVHCHAGICRSGAVVEVGKMMGFTPTDRFRQPNLRVKHKMMKALGWTYDSDEKPSSTGGYLSLND
jgi:rhodanese-related sulfurtransferase